MDKGINSGTDSNVVQISRLIDGYHRCLDDILDTDIDKIVNDIMMAGTVYTAGNGGSSAIASHFASDLRHVGVKAVCLTDNVSRLTALANDYSYDEVFEKQLEESLTFGDVLVVISSSGNSKNIVRAVDLAYKKNVISIGFCGFRGGKVFLKADRAIHINSDDYGEVEGVHSCLCHIIPLLITKKREAESSLDLPKKKGGDRRGS